MPAWTDRILFRGSADERGGGECGGGASAPTPPPASTPAAVVGTSGYGCLPEVTDSDHKPVWAALSLALAVVPPAAARCAAAAALGRATPAGGADATPPTASLTPATLALNRTACGAATLTNTGTAPLAWRVWAGGEEGDTSGGAPGLPDWLDLAPTGGLLPPGASVTLVAEAALAEDVYYSHAHTRRAHCLVVGRAVGGGGGEWSAPLEVTLDG